MVKELLYIKQVKISTKASFQDTFDPVDMPMLTNFQKQNSN